MQIMSAEEVQERLQELIGTVVEEREQIQITSDVGNVVMMSENTYNDLLVTLEFLSTPGLLDNWKQRNAEQFEFEFNEEEIQA